MEGTVFQEELKKRASNAEETVRECFASYLDRFDADKYSKTVRDAMEYSILGGGKRLRPLLMKETFELFAGDCGREKATEVLRRFMTAMEMIHTYSLVHDDLPAMDNDMYRRGRETTWKQYGDAMAVLAGDALMNSAFEIAFDAITECVAGGDPELSRRAAYCGKILAGKAGVGGMLGGQVADVESEKRGLPMTEEKLKFIHTYKTAALIEASMMIGAVLAGADETEVSLVEKIAENVGLAFQIQDDILDVIGDSAELGKPVGSDEESGKQTCVTFMGLEESKKMVERLSREAADQLKTLPGDHEFLEALILYLIYRNK